MCRKKKRIGESEYTADDIRSVSAACGHMDFSHSYSFCLRRGENSWLLDAEFAPDTVQTRVEYEGCPVEEQDAQELLSIVREQKITEKLRRYKKPKLKVIVSDETAYYTAILLADGARLGAAIFIGAEAEACFYRLAEKYSGTAPKP